VGGHAERVADQGGRLGAADRPADDEPRERVQDDAAADLALAGEMLGDVGHPEQIRAVAGEVATHEIQRGHLGDPRAPRQPAGRQALDPQLAHDQLHRVATHLDAPMQQLGPDAVGAVGAARGLVDIDDLRSQPDPA
jgi:hypothetical protein